MNLVDAIKANQKRHTGYASDERILRKIRQRVFDYEDAGKYPQAARIIVRLQERLAPYHRAMRATRDAAKLERTPSAFEPGLNHNR